ncbi:hypothetical protein Aperf_G00000062488 [Anoplocephala perfoliata]
MGPYSEFEKKDSVIGRPDCIAIPDWLSLAPGVQTKPRAGIVVPGTLDRLIGMLSVASEELSDCPFYFQSDKLCATLHTTVPKIALLRSAFLNAGYRVSFSHAALSSLKTDAPMSFIWDVMCAWKRKHETEVAAARDTAEDQSKQPQESSLIEADDGDDNDSKSNSKKRKKYGKKHPPSADALRVVSAMMARPPNPKVCFDPHPDANPPSRADGLLRYQMNPPNWGPKARPSRENNQMQKPPEPKRMKPS